MNKLHGVRVTLAVAAAASLLGGCSLFSTTTDGVTSAVNGVTDVTSSTSGSKHDNNKSAFVNTRFEAIRLEAARGEGENLDSLAQLLGETDHRAFGRWMQSHYAQLFTGLKEPRELLARIEQYRDERG